MGRLTLTPKQKRFVQEYLIDMNGTQAAIRAGYSKKTAKEIASENLTKLNIQKALQARMDKITAKTELSVQNVLNDLLETRDICASVMKQTDEEGTETVDTAAVNGRIKSNELLGKHLRIFTDKIELEVTKMPTIVIGKNK